jgi:hypothetical protein
VTVAQSAVDVLDDRAGANRSPSAYDGTLDASGNWWDTAIGANPSNATAPTAINGLISGSVTVGSFLDSGTNAATGNGFTPAATTEMWVPKTAATSGLSFVNGNIQESIDAAISGMTVRVAADTYTNNLTISKSLSVIGAGTGATTVNANSGVGVTVSGSGNTVSLRGFSITHGSSAITGSALTALNLTDLASSDNSSGGSLTGSIGAVSLTAAGGISVSADASAQTFGDAVLQAISYAGATLSNLNLGTLGNANAFTVKPVTGGATDITIDGGTPYPSGNTSILSLNMSAVSAASNPVINFTGPGAGNLSTSAPTANPVSWVHITLSSGATVAGNSLYLIGADTNDQLNITPSGASQTGSTGVNVNGRLDNININNQTFTQAFTTIYVVGFGGNDSFRFAGSLTIATVISDGDGNDSLQLGNGANRVTVGNGNDTIQGSSGSPQGGNGNNTIIAGNGNDKILLGNGNNTVTVGSGNDFVQLGNGTNTVTGGTSGSTGILHVQLGNGASDNVSITGNANDQVKLGNGNNDTVSVTDTGKGNDQVQVGNGDNDSVSILGNGTGNDQVQVGAGTGDSVLIVGNGNENVHTGNGTGTVTIHGTGQKRLKLGNGWTHN